MTILRNGQLFCGQYRVDQHLASTGMSDVYKVWDIKRNVPLAMKVLSGEQSEDPSSIKVLYKEAERLQKLKHQNIVPFYGFYEEEGHYLLLELFIDGPNLKDILSSIPDHKMSIQDVLIFMKSLGSALGYSHNKNIIHCDIKPGNVLIDKGGMIYLTDFGIARHSDSSITMTNVGAGTTPYMAPEQIMEGEVTPATDVYALGIMVYEMLVGRRPFRGDDENIINTGRNTEERLRNAHLKIEPPDPRRFGAELSEEQVQVVLKALNKKPYERHQTPLEFFEALCAVSGIRSESVATRYVVSRYFQPPEPEPFGLTDEQKYIPRPNKIPKWFFGLIGVVLVGLLFLIIKPSKAKLNPNLTKTITEVVTETSTFLVENETTPTVIAATSIPTEKPLGVGSIRVSSKDQMTMVYVPASEFLMGGDANQAMADCQKFRNDCNMDFFLKIEPIHTVFLDSYWIDQTEVTNAMYATCVNAGVCSSPAKSNSAKRDDYYGNSQYAKYPVIFVNWDQAKTYCEWAGRQLPSEAQWEKAAKGTDGRTFPWGNEYPSGGDSNFADRNNSSDWANMAVDDGYNDTAPVGSYPSGISPYGAMDMAGNVWEWVADYYKGYTSDSQNNPIGPVKGINRVLRGGSWGDDVSSLRSDIRVEGDPGFKGGFDGFRCALPEK
jgi:eukaryotic-like serine/threonine-protein kinase